MEATDRRKSTRDNPLHKYSANLSMLVGISGDPGQLLSPHCSTSRTVPARHQVKILPEEEDQVSILHDKSSL